MKYLIPLLFLTLSCSQTSVVAPDLEYVETKNDKPTGGVVVYNPLGLKQLVKQRRNQAIKRIRQACDPYGWKITKEETSTLDKRGSEKYKNNSHIASLAGSKIRFLDYKYRD